MKKLEGQKAQLPVNCIYRIAFISTLSFFIFSSPGYGNTDIPVKVKTAPVAIGATALFAGFGGGSAQTNQGIFSIVSTDIDTTAASTFVTAFHDEDAVYTETLIEVGKVNGTIHTTHPPCQDSCSLSM